MKRLIFILVVSVVGFSAMVSFATDASSDETSLDRDEVVRSCFLTG